MTKHITAKRTSTGKLKTLDRKIARSVKRFEHHTAERSFQQVLKRH